MVVLRRSGSSFFGKIADDGALAIVRDAHAVAEHGEQRLLAGHQVGLQEVLADGVAGLELEGFVNPGVLLGHGFFLDEDGAELAVCGKGGDGGPVNIPVVGAEPIEDLGDKGGIDGGVEFVGFHGEEILSGGESMRSSAAWQGRRREKIEHRPGAVRMELYRKIPLSSTASPGLSNSCFAMAIMAA